MKTLYLYLIALMTALAMPALADGDATETRTVLANGCVLIDRGNGQLTYERGCPVIGASTSFNLPNAYHGRSGLIDTDADGIGDRWTNDLNG